jgi:hypothetical protein
MRENSYTAVEHENEDTYIGSNLLVILVQKYSYWRTFYSYWRTFVKTEERR